MTNGLPAVLGGTPVFEKKLQLARPALPSFEEVSDELRGIFESGVLTSSKYVREFEAAAAEYLGVKDAIALSSCTSGLMLAVRAMELTGEVILPSFTFFASAHALVWNNLKPVFVDCEPDTLAVSVEEVEKHITKKTSAIMGVHIFGNPTEIKELGKVARHHDIKLFFDAAHALGSKYGEEHVGGFGDAEIFSLSPSKVLTTGEGGLVTTNDAKLGRAIRIGRDYGNPGDYDPEFAGISARMTEFSALIGLHSLPGLDEVIAFRNELASLYIERLSKVPGIRFQKVGEGNTSTYKMFAVMIDDKEFGMKRDVLMESLAAENIETRRYFFPPVHTLKIYKGHKAGDMPNTNRAADEILCLPLNTHMSDSDAEGVCEAIARIREHRDEICG